MVIDWNKQIDECIRNTKIMPIFNGKPASYMYEHRLIIKRLEDMGYSDVQIANWMILAESNIVFDVDNVKFIKKHYGRLAVPKKHDFRVFITADEIQYIDSMKASLENKSYLLALVCYLKLMKVRAKRPVLKPGQSAYIYYLAFGTDDYWNGKARGRWISKFIRHLCAEKIIEEDSRPTRYVRHTSKGPVKVSICDIKVTAKWVQWNAAEGYCIQNPEVDIRLLVGNAFKGMFKECTNCGASFEVTPYTKTTLCPECQKAMRYQKNRDWYKEHPDYVHNKLKTHSHGRRDLKKGKGEPKASIQKSGAKTGDAVFLSSE